MLECQRGLFDMPGDVAYLNAAAYSPVPRVVREAGVAGAAEKSVPWGVDRERTAAQAERVRELAGRVIGAGAADMAIMGSVSHALTTAARALPVGSGERILRVAGEQSSNCLVWARLAEERGAVVDVVPAPEDGDWTAAVLARIAAPGPRLAIAALTPCHWTDGSVIDLGRIAPAVRAAGAALVVDATQAAGAVPIDVGVLQPDFLAFPTYKWVLGSYNLAFLYAGAAWQAGEPLERNGFNCLADAACLDVQQAAGARRYDMGERNNPVALPMAEAGLEMVLGWGIGAVEARLRWLTDALGAAAAGLGVGMAARDRRVGNILGLRVPGGLRPGMLSRLEAEGVYASDRQGVLRVSPHVYNDVGDVERFSLALGRLLRD